MVTAHLFPKRQFTTLATFSHRHQTHLHIQGHSQRWALMPARTPKRFTFLIPSINRPFNECSQGTQNTNDHPVHVNSRKCGRPCVPNDDSLPARAISPTPCRRLKDSE